MILPDTNLLLYAYNTDSPFHAAARGWWERCLGGTEAVGLCAGVAFGFLRVATSPRSFRHPMLVGEATMAVRVWLDQPGVLWLEGGERYAEGVMRLLEACGTAGDLVSDAQLAAVALERGGVVHTADADFTRFAGVRWRNPLRAR